MYSGICAHSIEPLLYIIILDFHNRLYTVHVDDYAWVIFIVVSACQNSLKYNSV